ncbi:hypothetical protein Bca4012_006086 [Brassica carinata]
MKKNSGARFCVPRVKTNLSRTTAGDRNISVTPMTLLDRFREAVLRIIMISAPSNPTPRRSKPTRVNSQKYYNSTDTYHNEAVVSSLSGPTRAAMLKTAAKAVTHLFFKFEVEIRKTSQKTARAAFTSRLLVQTSQKTSRKTSRKTSWKASWGIL